MSKFGVKTKVDKYVGVTLSVTNNGYQWSSIGIRNPIEEIPQIVNALIEVYGAYFVYQHNKMKSWSFENKEGEG